MPKTIERPLDSYSTQLVFKDPVLKALWDEELSGQMSDGAWENSPRAKWLWEDTSTILGEVNEVRVDWASRPGKRNFNIYRELECVDDRMLDIIQKFNPEYTLKDLKQMLKTIQEMLKNPVVDNEIYQRKDEWEQRLKKAAKKRLKEAAEKLGFKFSETYTFASPEKQVVPDEFYAKLSLTKVDKAGTCTIQCVYGSKVKFQVKIEDYPEFEESFKGIYKFLSRY